MAGALVVVDEESDFVPVVEVEDDESEGESEDEPLGDGSLADDDSFAEDDPFDDEDRLSVR